MALTILGGPGVGDVKVPFLLDLDAHVRFLGTIPLLIGAELIVIPLEELLDRAVGVFF